MGKISKMSSVLIAALALVVLAPSLWAQAKYVSVEIPFDFYVSGALMPAGTYAISHDSIARITRIVGRNGHIATVLPLPSVTAVTDRNRIVFNRYGNSYFLSEMFWANSNNALKVRESQLEREARLATPRIQVSIDPRD